MKTFYCINSINVKNDFKNLNEFSETLIHLVHLLLCFHKAKRKMLN